MTEDEKYLDWASVVCDLARKKKHIKITQRDIEIMHRAIESLENILESQKQDE